MRLLVLLSDTAVVGGDFLFVVLAACVLSVVVTQDPNANKHAQTRQTPMDFFMSVVLSQTDKSRKQAGFCAATRILKDECEPPSTASFVRWNAISERVAKLIAPTAPHFNIALGEADPPLRSLRSKAESARANKCAPAEAGDSINPE